MSEQQRALMVVMAMVVSVLVFGLLVYIAGTLNEILHTLRNPDRKAAKE